MCVYVYVCVRSHTHIHTHTHIIPTFRYSTIACYITIYCEEIHSSLIDVQILVS